MYSSLTSFEGSSFQNTGQSRVNVCHCIVFFLNVHIRTKGAKYRNLHAKDGAVFVVLQQCFVEIVIESLSAYCAKNVLQSGTVATRTKQKSWKVIQPLVDVDQRQCLPEQVEGENGA